MVFWLDFKLFHLCLYLLKINTEMLMEFTSGRGRRVRVEIQDWAGAGNCWRGGTVCRGLLQYHLYFCMCLMFTVNRVKNSNPRSTDSASVSMLSLSCHHVWGVVQRRHATAVTRKPLRVCLLPPCPCEYDFLQGRSLVHHVCTTGRRSKREHQILAFVKHYFP